MACVWKDEEAAALPGRYEPLLVEEDANLREIAEEELLLALPAFPLHENDCKTVEQAAALQCPRRLSPPCRTTPTSRIHLVFWSS